MQRGLRNTLFLIIIALFSWGIPVIAQEGQVHTVQAGESLASIAAQYDVDMLDIMQANNLVNADFIVVGQTLSIPGSVPVSVRAGVSGLSSGQNAASFQGTYTVQAGDTLSSIALAYNTTAEALANANGMSVNNFILLGQVLSVPGNSVQPARNFAPNTQAVYTCNNYYTVRVGDTLSALAWSYNSTVQAIRQTNNLSSDIIYVGQSLCVPGQASYTPPPASTGYARHVVQAGETLSGIAWRYGVTLYALSNANNIYNNSLIYVGQVLAIPGKAKPTAPPQSKPSAPQATPAPQTSGPDYTPPRQYPNANPPGCFNPQDALGSETPTHQDTAPPDYEPNPQTDLPTTLVQAVDRWCADISYSDDPDGLTSIAIRTLGQPGTRVQIQVGTELVTAVTGNMHEPNNAAFEYKALPPGTHEVYVLGANSERALVKVSAGQRAYVDFRYTSVSEDPRPRSATGWSAYVSRNTGGASAASSGVWSVIIARAGASGLPISIRSEGNGFHSTCYTGTKPELGGGACEFAGLWPGKYTLNIEGTDIAAEVFVDGAGVAEVVFDRY